MNKLSAIVMGYGMRGRTYARHAVDFPDQLEIVAVADPNESYRRAAMESHNIPENMTFSDWKELAKLPKLADFAIIATQDAMHIEPALACIEKGYNLLLEKPMAPTAEECKIITEAAEKKGIKVVVCHVLRFTPFFCKIKDIIDSGEIGDVVSIIHSENVGNTHQAHSFVRGNWRNTAESAPMILAKSCHDMDIVQWLIGKKCKKIQSFGSLTHFTKENQPKGAPDRCLDNCPYAETCFYEPVRFYIENKENPWRDIVANKVGATDEDILEGIKTGPYGRCVYACDNDVVDHQVVNMEFEDGVTVSFTMCAFNQGGRHIVVFGTKGQIVAAHSEEGDIEVFLFNDDSWTKRECPKIGDTIASGHGGGDVGIMIDTINHFSGKETSKSISDARTSYLNHIMAFAAEESRLTDTVIDIDQFEKNIWL